MAVSATASRGTTLDADEIVQLAFDDLPGALSIARVDPNMRDEVGSFVLQQIWQKFLPRAEARFRSGEWENGDLRSKLRTSLITYAKSRAIDVSRARGRLARGDECASRPDDVPFDEPAPRDTISTAADPELDFFRGLVSAVKQDLRGTGMSRSRTALRMALLFRRSVGIDRLPKGPWAAGLVRQTIRILEDHDGV